MIFLLTGESGSGKTTLLGELATIFFAHGLAPGGFTAPGTWSDAKRSGFMLHDIRSNLDYLLAETGTTGNETQGRFVFDEKTLDTGNLLLKNQAGDTSIDFIMVDEVGPFELRGKGWASSLDILACAAVPQLWVVRPELLAAVPVNWNFRPEVVFFASADTAGEIFRKIAEYCSFPEK